MNNKKKEINRRAYGLGETAKLYSVSISSIRRWSENPNHPFPAGHKIGGRLMFFAGDLDNFDKKYCKN